MLHFVSVYHMKFQQYTQQYTKDFSFKCAKCEKSQNSGMAVISSWVFFWERMSVEMLRTLLRWHQPETMEGFSLSEQPPHRITFSFLLHWQSLLKCWDLCLVKRKKHLFFVKLERAVLRRSLVCGVVHFHSTMNFGSLVIEPKWLWIENMLGHWQNLRRCSPPTFWPEILFVYIVVIYQHLNSME